MLYDRWRQVAGDRAGETALIETASGRRWTFAELDAAAAGPLPGDGPVLFPQGRGPEFVIAVLQAWRRNRVVCPLEGGQAPPGVPEPPAGCVHLKTTSATSGPARFVAFTAEQLAADAGNIVATMGLRPECPNLALISLAHSYGFSNLVTPLLLHGIPLVLAESALPEAVRRAASTVARATLAGVPALWRAWHAAEAIPPNLWLAISAGAPLPLALEQEIFQQHHLKVHNFYGATECGGIAYDPSETPRTDGTVAGRPLRQVLLSVGEDGCLEVRGAAVGQAYWPNASPELSGCCYRTADLAALRDGHVLRGRAGDRINIAGRKLSPETVEGVLRGHPSVRDCLVLGLPDPQDARSERVGAVVALEGNARVADLREFLLARLPSWQVPRDWHFVEDLEPNARGKLSRADWRSRLAGNSHPSGTDR